VSMGCASVDLTNLELKIFEKNCIYTKHTQIFGVISRTEVT
jgi:hypothetical protein